MGFLEPVELFGEGELGEPLELLLIVIVPAMLPRRGDQKDQEL